MGISSSSDGKAGKDRDGSTRESDTACVAAGDEGVKRGKKLRNTEETVKGMR